YFLDKIVQEIVELAEQRIAFYKGNYSFYLEEKNKREEIQEKNQKHLQEKKAHLEKFIERFRYKATKASQVQSRIKMLEKIDPIKIKKTSNHVHFRFPSAPRSGEEVVLLKNITHGYGQKKVFQGINVTIHCGDRVALVGINGAGKSTLSRIISGIESPNRGIVDWGYRVKIAFFSQESSQNLNYQHTVWDEIDRNGKQLTNQEKRDLLGSFLFTGENINKSVHQLSGGEKSRLALAKLLLEESNLLILDEPGNHLDIKTKNIFYETLKQYRGTILIVSHDRFFLDQLVNRVIEIREGKVYSYPGNYSYFIQKRQLILDKEKQEKSQTSHAKNYNRESKPSLVEKEKKRMQAEQRNQQYRFIRNIEKELNPLEEKIHHLDREKADIEEKLCQKDILQNSEKVQTLMVDLHQINSKLNNLMKKWETLMNKKE
ncbi:MAG: ABC-F family ATP-binding cassette domain-containing protein, partial [Elusimicrobiota bacterium]